MAQSGTNVKVAAPERGSTEPQGWMREALWLAGKDMRASWLSYPATVVVAGLFGLLATAQFDNAITGDNGAFGAGLLDFYLLCIVSAFGTNLIFNRDYYTNMKMEGFDERLSFLKSLPVSARSVVTGRTICAVVAIIFAAPVFFALPYLINNGLRDVIGVGGYVGFCLFWVGYALVFTGAWYVYGSFAVRWDFARLWVYVAVFLGASVLIPAAFRLLFGESISLTVMGFAGDHGLVLAGVSLLVGVIAVVLSIRKAEVGLARRDVG